MKVRTRLSREELDSATLEMLIRIKIRAIDKRTHARTASLWLFGDLDGSASMIMHTVAIGRHRRIRSAFAHVLAWG